MLHIDEVIPILLTNNNIQFQLFGRRKLKRNIFWFNGFIRSQTNKELGSWIKNK
jgi:hypothetical protein